MPPRHMSEDVLRATPPCFQLKGAPWTLRKFYFDCVWMSRQHQALSTEFLEGRRITGPLLEAAGQQRDEREKWHLNECRCGWTAGQFQADVLQVATEHWVNCGHLFHYFYLSRVSSTFVSTIIVSWHRNVVVCPRMILQTRCTRPRPGLERFSGGLDVSRLAGLFPPSFSELLFGCAPQAVAQHKGSYCQDLIQGLHSFSNMVG